MDQIFNPVDYSATRSFAFYDDEYTQPPRIAGHSSSFSSSTSTSNSAEPEWETSSTRLPLGTNPNWSSGREGQAHNSPGGFNQQHFSYTDSFFGSRSFEPNSQTATLQDTTSTFDDLLQQFPQQHAMDTLVYQLAYEPLQWMLPSNSTQTIEIPSNQSVPDPILGLSLEDSAVKPSTRRRRSHLITRARHERPSHSSPLRREHRSNTTPITHTCAQCYCTFARARDLKRHFRLHTGEKPYQCLGCGEGFIRVDSRKRHWNYRPECLRIHEGSS